METKRTRIYKKDEDKKKSRTLSLNDKEWKKLIDTAEKNELNVSNYLVKTLKLDK